MIFVLLLAVWALTVARINVAKDFRITGRRARFYGATLILAALPFRWGMSLLLVLLFPASWLQNAVTMAVTNAIALTGFVLVLAIPFRDREAEPVTTAV